MKPCFRSIIAVCSFFVLLSCFAAADSAVMKRAQTETGEKSVVENRSNEKIRRTLPKDAGQEETDREGLFLRVIRERLVQDSGLLVLFGSVLSISAILYACVRKGRWAVCVLMRQREFRKRYENGLVSRPIGMKTCWFCGGFPSGMARVLFSKDRVPWCSECMRLVVTPGHWLFCSSFFFGAAAFVVSVYFLYLRSWGCLNPILAYLWSGLIGVGTFAGLFFGSMILILWLYRTRIACLGNLENELEFLRKQVHDMMRQDRKAALYAGLSEEEKVRLDKRLKEMYQDYLDCLKRSVDSRPDDAGRKSFYEALLANGEFFDFMLDDVLSDHNAGQTASDK